MRLRQRAVLEGGSGPGRTRVQPGSTLWLRAHEHTVKFVGEGVSGNVPKLRVTSEGCPLRGVVSPVGRTSVTVKTNCALVLSVALVFLLVSACCSAVFSPPLPLSHKG